MILLCTVTFEVRVRSQRNPANAISISLLFAKVVKQNFADASYKLVMNNITRKSLVGIVDHMLFRFCQFSIAVVLGQSQRVGALFVKCFEIQLLVEFPDPDIPSKQEYTMVKHLLYNEHRGGGGGGRCPTVLDKKNRTN